MTPGSGVVVVTDAHIPPVNLDLVNRFDATCFILSIIVKTLFYTTFFVHFSKTFLYCHYADREELNYACFGHFNSAVHSVGRVQHRQREPREVKI